MVRPEPDQPLGKADLGRQRRIEARLGLVEIDLLRSGADRRPRTPLRIGLGIVLRLRVLARVLAAHPWAAHFSARPSSAHPPRGASRAVLRGIQRPRAPPCRCSSGQPTRARPRPRDRSRRSAHRADRTQWPRPSRRAVRARTDAAPAPLVLLHQVPCVTVSAGRCSTCRCSTCRSIEPNAITRLGYSRVMSRLRR